MQNRRFNPKDFPLSDFGDVQPVYVDDLAVIERIGSTVRLSFAAVDSEPYSPTERRRSRFVKARLILPAERWRAILHQLKVDHDSESDLSIVDHYDMTAH